MAFSISTEQWPLVTVELQREFSDHELQRYLEAVKAILSRRERYVMYTDASASTGISAASRRELMAFVSCHAHAFDRYQLGNALLLKSSLQRGILTALTWLAPMPGTVRGFAERDEAIAWLDSRLVEATGHALRSPVPWA